VHSEDTALKSLNIVRKQAELGQVNSLAILNAQQTYLTALLTRVQAQASRFADTAALSKPSVAAGGIGWTLPRMSTTLVAPGASSFWGRSSPLRAGSFRGWRECTAAKR